MRRNTISLWTRMHVGRRQLDEYSPPMQMKVIKRLWVDFVLVAAVAQVQLVPGSKWMSSSLFAKKKRDSMEKRLSGLMERMMTIKAEKHMCSIERNGVCVLSFSNVNYSRHRSTFINLRFYSSLGLVRALTSLVISIRLYLYLRFYLHRWIWKRKVLVIGRAQPQFRNWWNHWRNFRGRFEWIRPRKAIWDYFISCGHWPRLTNWLSPLNNVEHCCKGYGWERQFTGVPAKELLCEHCRKSLA